MPDPRDKIDDGGNAFPCPMSEYRNDDGAVTHRQPDQSGMTLRDYVAAKALPTIINLTQSNTGEWSFDNCAAAAYEMADAMLAARKAAH